MGFVLCVIFVYVSRFFGGLSNDQTIFGLFGDYIGGTLGALFAFLSFLALLYTINLQRQDIIASRQELDVQRFENTFFNMLNQISNLINSYGFKDRTGPGNFNDMVKDYLKGTVTDKEPVRLFSSFITHISNIVLLINRESAKDKKIKIDRELYESILYNYLSVRYIDFIKKYYQDYISNDESAVIKEFLDKYDHIALGK